MIIPKNIENPFGYFFIIATARSGHNFIKSNILSWTNDIEKEKRCYVNLEGSNPEKFYDNIDGIDLSLYPNSIKVLVCRSLTNWFPSLINLRKIPERSKKLRPNQININNVIHNKEFIELQKVNPNIENNPDLVIIPDDLVKQDFIKSKNKTLSKSEVSVSLNTSLHTWLKIAKEFKGETSYLDGFIKIYYDDFFMYQEYRKNICEQLNGEYNENFLNVVTREGNFSSFDKDKYQNNAQNMDVLHRWRNLDKEYLPILKNHEALEFYINNFNITLEEKKFIASL